MDYFFSITDTLMQHTIHPHDRSLVLSGLHNTADLQGKRAKGREQQLAGLYEGISSVLELLGMWQGSPQAVLKEMRSKWLLK